MRDARRSAPEPADARAGARGDRHIFLRHWLHDPLGIGAAQPSGGRVARAMARQVALDRPGAVLGLGGEEVARIWAHFLPTQVWRYWRRPAADEARQ